MLAGYMLHAKLCYMYKFGVDEGDISEMTRRSEGCLGPVKHLLKVFWKKVID